MPNFNNTQVQPLVETSTALDASWMVIIHDDPVNLMPYVTVVIQKILGCSIEKAQDLMMQVHNNGKAIIWSGNKEKAEFYVQQLHTHQLTASLETV